MSKQKIRDSSEGNICYILWTKVGDNSGKEPACPCRRHKRCVFDLWVREIPWRKKWQPTPVFLPAESCGQRGLAGCGPQGCKESNTTEATQHKAWTKVALTIQRINVMNK